MARQQAHTPEEIVAKLRQAEVLVGQGKTVADAVRALAVATDRRLPQLPDTPTATEAGVAGFIFGTSFGMAAPAGTPPSVINAVAEGVAAALCDPATGGRLADQGTILGGQGPAAFAALIAQEKQTLEPVIRRTGIIAN